MVDATQLRFLHIAGTGNSGPQHWHTHWEATDPRCSRIIQDDWDHGSRADWVARIDEGINGSTVPAVLMAHSLGNIALTHWAASSSGPVLGAFLVAPSDIDGDWVEPGAIYEGFRPTPMDPLPFPSVMIASTNDPYLSVARATEFAAAWGSELTFVGDQQHLGSECDLGVWPEGAALRDAFVARLLS